MKSIEDAAEYLKNYNGAPVTLMEICGSHTAAIAKNGLKSMISSKIRLVSGPGCPVCVTPSAYIDRLIEISKQPHTCVVTFGDLLRVPGSSQSLSQARGAGGTVRMVYAPGDILQMAKDNPAVCYVFAAVGFETTIPVYALLMERITKEQISNIKLLTALKTMPEAVGWLCSNHAQVDGFIAPGHVCAVTGSQVFLPLSLKYRIPFGVAGFRASEILLAIYGLVRMIEDKKTGVKNYYPSVVSENGNGKALEIIDRYFEKYDAVWRGMGCIPNSGLVLRKQFSDYDAGSLFLTDDYKINPACCCEKVLMGQLQTKKCPLFRKVCTPLNPQGACMVSSEGSCYQAYLNEEDINRVGERNGA